MASAAPETVDDAVAGQIERPGSGRELKREALPPELQDMHADLREALKHDEPGAEMPEDVSYPPAQQVKAIATVLIERVPSHQELSEARIKYVYRDGLQRKGRETLGRMDRVGRKWRELAGIDYLLQVNLEPYAFMSPAERIRLVDHELCHAERDGTDWASRPHDVEEFNEIVDRWGTWDRMPELNRLLEHGAQGDLFETT